MQYVHHFTFGILHPWLNVFILFSLFLYPISQYRENKSHYLHLIDNSLESWNTVFERVTQVISS